MNRLFFLFFLLSGCCSLVYETVWTRLAMASFGVTTTVVSVVLSVFMLGLALGSYLAGAPRFLCHLRTGRRALRLYALVEAGIGLGGVLVPLLFVAARRALLGLGESSSAGYHGASALLLGAVLLPATTLMGSTFALALSALRAAASDLPFSYLYLANVLGATLGTLATPLAVELVGFYHALLCTAALNLVIAGLGVRLSRDAAFEAPLPPAAAAPAPDSPTGEVPILLCLLGTGFASMGMEVVWTRLFSMRMGTFVYGFAAILASYLFATYVGSLVYRRRAVQGRRSLEGILWATLGPCSVLPLLFADRRLSIMHGTFGWKLLCVAVAVAPFCASLGLLTPLLVDRFSGGHAGRAARAYAVNVVGCILGPLCAGYLLLPLLGERGALGALCGVPLCIGLWAAVRPAPSGLPVRPVFGLGAVATVAAIGLLRDPSEYLLSTAADAHVRRDHTATVVALNQSRDPAKPDRRLLVNGVGMTLLTPLTKVIAHLPAALLSRPPRSALVLCFGMGTTVRSFESWGIDTTAVDLIPSVPTFFSYFHADADRVLGSGRVHIVIDDGRRFLDRTRGRFDVIALDPPPPVEAAGSSLLYSREFYQAARARLAPGGVLQQWMPGGEPAVVVGMIQALRAEFPHVRVFVSLDGMGVHMLGSDQPIVQRTAAEMAAQLPLAAQADLVEWDRSQTPAQVFQVLLSREQRVDEVLKAAGSAPMLTDDQPVNEYYLLRRWLGLGEVAGAQAR